MLVSSPMAFLITVLLYGSAAATTDGVDNVSASVYSEDGGLKGLAPPSRIGPDSAVFNPSLDSYFSLNLLAAFPEDLEISDYCVDLLRIFGQRYVTYVNCLVSSARPVKVCLNCFVGYDNLNEIYKNISQTGPGNVSCKDSLLRSDRLMLVYMLQDNLEKIWTTSGCERCLHNSDGLHSLTNDTLTFMVSLNQSLGCFEKYQQNHSELCKQCKPTYKGLSQLYGTMQENNKLCIDIEDSMNMTRKLWSKNFNCSFPREETVPVIAVSSFMLFLPIIFYLSSFLHSEQKKRKLIHPKRAKSKTTLMNIQDKFS